jgi:L-ascorbate metabolism protein UlaG (beta-lactamase superfamily)
MSDKVYLKQNVQAEPLINQWYAVSLTLPPTTGAMFVANSHLKIMRSYILAPEMHIAANHDPALMGGPFINFKEQRVADVKALLDKTVKEQAHIIEFAEAVKRLDLMLNTEAKGYSLEPFYEKVPDVLRGYVELVYDLKNNPSIRFIEKLIYKSPLYDLSAQSIGFSLVTEDNRPFVLSTPRLDNQDYLRLRIPFRDRRWDELFRMKGEAGCFGEIRDVLELNDEEAELFKTFLTTEKAAERPDSRYRGAGVRIRYFGHACLLIETREVCILTDPFISYQYESDIERYTFADLPDEIDYILITHGHLDHLVLETLLQLRHKTKGVIVPRNSGGSMADPSLKLLLESVGFRRVIDVDELESLDAPGGSITALPFFGEHHDLNIKSKASYLITLDGKRICVAADSCSLDVKVLERIHDEFGDVDALFIGMECDGAPVSWFYGALFTTPLDRERDYSRQGSACNHGRARETMRALGCKQVYVYAMGLEPWLTYILSINYNDDSKQMLESKNFIAECEKSGVGAEMLYGHKTILL